MKKRLVMFAVALLVVLASACPAKMPDDQPTDDATTTTATQTPDAGAPDVDAAPTPSDAGTNAQEN